MLVFWCIFAHWICSNGILPAEICTAPWDFALRGVTLTSLTVQTIVFFTASFPKRNGESCRIGRLCNWLAGLSRHYLLYCSVSYHTQEYTPVTTTFCLQLCYQNLKGIKHDRAPGLIHDLRSYPPVPSLPKSKMHKKHTLCHLNPA